VDLELGGSEQAHQVFDVSGQGIGNEGHAQFLEQGQTGVQGMDPQYVGAAAFEPAGRTGGLPIHSVIITAVFHHVPSVLVQA